jgi:hypothetical protein
MRSCRNNPCQAITNFVGSFFRQSHEDFKTSYEKRKSEPLYAFTRYIPRTEDLPIPPSKNRYTLIRQLNNALTLAYLCFQSKEEIAVTLALTPVLNAYLQHVLYPSLQHPKNNEAAEPKTSPRI